MKLRHAIPLLLLAVVGSAQAQDKPNVVVMLAAHRFEGNGFPAVFNIESAPREEVNILGTYAWVIGPYLKVVDDYRKTLEKFPNPRAVNMTEFSR